MDTGPALTHTPCSRQRIRSAPPLPSYPSSRRRLRILPKLSPRFCDRLSLRRRPNTNTTLPVAGAFTLYRRCRRRRPLRLPLRILFFTVPRSLSLCVAVVLILRYLWWAPRHGSSSPPRRSLPAAVSSLLSTAVVAATVQVHFLKFPASFRVSHFFVVVLLLRHLWWALGHRSSPPSNAPYSK